MESQDPFLPQIRKSPGDVSIRLVYADWLAEHGDNRSELIRIEAELALFAPHTDKYIALKQHRRKLRADTCDQWLRAMGYVPKQCPFFETMPALRSDRWRLIEDFVETWDGPLQSKDGYSEEELRSAEQQLGMQIPMALREWYLLAGKRERFWSRQDRLLLPDDLRFDPDKRMLIVRIENQGCELWGIPVNELGNDDPPVFELYEWRQSSETTSAFAIQVMLYSTMFSRDVIQAGDQVGEELIEQEVISKYSRCDIPEQYWVGSPVRIYEGNDLLIQTDSVGWVYVVARTEEVFSSVSETLRNRLERYR